MVNMYGCFFKLTVSLCRTVWLVTLFFIIEWAITHSISITVWADCMESRIAYIANSWLEQVSGARYMCLGQHVNPSVVNMPCQVSLIKPYLLVTNYTVLFCVGNVFVDHAKQRRLWSEDGPFWCPIPQPEPNEVRTFLQLQQSWSRSSCQPCHFQVCLLALLVTE